MRKLSQYSQEKIFNSLSRYHCHFCLIKLKSKIFLLMLTSISRKKWFLSYSKIEMMLQSRWFSVVFFNKSVNVKVVSNQTVSHSFIHSAQSPIKCSIVCLRLIVISCHQIVSLQFYSADQCWSETHSFKPIIMLVDSRSGVVTRKQSSSVLWYSLILAHLTSALWPESVISTNTF